MSRIEDLENWARSHFFGKYRATVVDNQDLLGQKGRIKVNVPAVLASTSVWAMPCVPYAGDGVGFYFIPPNGAGVWVEFEGGDLSYPIWSGCFWSDGQLPTDVLSSDTRLLETENAQFKINDLLGEVELSNSSNVKTTWSTDIEANAGTSTHTVGGIGVVSQSAPGKVEVGASGVVINDGAFKVT